MMKTGGRNQGLVNLRPLSLILRLIFVFIFFSFIIKPIKIWAASEIIHPFQSVRSVGMGGVIIGTGLYEENFFNNPARVNANPVSRWTVVQFTPLETNRSTLDVLGAVTSPDEELSQALSVLSGKYLHARSQLVLPAYYHALGPDQKWAFGIGFISSVQTNWLLSDTFQATILGVADFGPALTVGRQFLEDRLSVGVTGHFMYRVSANRNYTLLNYLDGVPLTINSIGGQGSMVDFDLGATYRLTEFYDFEVDVSAASQNIFGGNFNIQFPKPFTLSNNALTQPTTLGLGVALFRPYIAFFHDTTLAFEVSSIGNDTNGSLYRLLHLGGETHYHSLGIRLGINQGYPSAGLAITLGALTLDAATYGEEIGLTVGTFEDRRYSLGIGINL